jgi:small-conductance mechanosensitive channel
VRKPLLAVASANDEVVDYPEPLVYFTTFGESWFEFVLNAWINDPKRRPDISSDLHFAIEAAFRKAGISMPFPQRDLHLVSGWERLRRDDS